MVDNTVGKTAGNLFKHAVRDAELLLEYTSRQGLEFDRAEASVITQAKKNVESNVWTPEDEAAFWQAYNSVAKRAAPVTVASIKATVDPPSHSIMFKLFQLMLVGKLRTTSARWHAAKYGLCTFTILAALITVQIYWSSGTSMLEKLEQANKEFAVLGDALVAEGESKKARADGSPEAKKIINQISRMKNQFDANLIIFKKFWQPDWLTEKSEKSAQSSGAPAHGAPEAVAGLASVEFARLMLQVIQANILPLLYGLLGASAYVLRTLSQRIKDVTYVPEANIGFGLRMQLGALGGLAIGWFYKPEAGNISSSLSPFALAFLAGYSVEVLFSAMDKFVLAFSGKVGQEAKPAQQKMKEGQPGNMGKKAELDDKTDIQS